MLSDTERVVRPLDRSTVRSCSRPGCPASADATLTFDYSGQRAFLGPLAAVEDAHAYDLCTLHAGRTAPPRGWSIADRRPEPLTDRGLDPSRLGDADTVAVLARALQAVPDEADDDIHDDLAPSSADIHDDLAPSSAAVVADPPADAEVIWVEDPPEHQVPAARPVMAARDRDPGRQARDW